jgi:hypothetical protein
MFDSDFCKLSTEQKLAYPNLFEIKGFVVVVVVVVDGTKTHTFTRFENI